MDAIDAVREDGLAAVLATGRILDELEHDFPQLVEHFDAVVAENGAVLVVAGDIQDLAPPVDDALARALDERTGAFRRGRVLLAATPRAPPPSWRPTWHWVWTARSCATGTH